MKNLRRITAVVVAITMMFTVFCATSFAAETQDDSVNGDYLKSVMDLINQKYNGNVTEEDLIQGAVKGMLGTLDDYSAYYTNDEYKAFSSSIQGAVEGVGIQVQFSDNYVTVLKAFSGSPAQKAGILSGDKIAEVDGESVVGKQLEDVIAKVKGTPGTKVKLGILRQGAKDIITLEMERAEVTIPSVSYEVRGDIGYILIEQFTATAYSGVKEALNFFDDKNITKVVVDLRNNPGGLVDQAVKIANCFVTKGLITRLDYKDESVKDEAYYSSLEKSKYKLAVLVNENSASASEILTGAIKDTKSGVVIGTKTFGKAKVQEFIPILTKDAYSWYNIEKTDRKDDAGVTVNAMDVNAFQSEVLGWAKMTVGLYYTPSGECIDLKGIEPNIKVEETSEAGIAVNLLEQLTVSVKPSLNTQYMDVYTAECILKLLKYDVDTPDLTLDKKTFAAIKKFQKDSKVGSYGDLDFTTQRLLNNKLAELKQTDDAVYAKAIEELK